MPLWQNEPYCFDWPTRKHSAMFVGELCRTTPTAGALSPAIVSKRQSEELRWTTRLIYKRTNRNSKSASCEVFMNASPDHTFGGFATPTQRAEFVERKQARRVPQSSSIKSGRP